MKNFTLENMQITEAHFVYPQSLKNTARITAFRNFLFSKIGDWNN